MYTEKVFEEITPYAISVLDGFNVCIFAYGQSGTSKTYTMEGIEGDHGVSYWILEELFHLIEEKRTSFNTRLSWALLKSTMSRSMICLWHMDEQKGTNTTRAILY